MPIERVAGTIRAKEPFEPYAVETSTGIYLVGADGKVREKLEPSICPACEREAGSKDKPCDYCNVGPPCSWCMNDRAPDELCACNT